MMMEPRTGLPSLPEHRPMMGPRAQCERIAFRERMMDHAGLTNGGKSTSGAVANNGGLSMILFSMFFDAPWHGYLDRVPPPPRP